MTFGTFPPGRCAPVGRYRRRRFAVIVCLVTGGFIGAAVGAGIVRTALFLTSTFFLACRIVGIRGIVVRRAFGATVAALVGAVAAVVTAVTVIWSVVLCSITGRSIGTPFAATTTSLALCPFFMSLIG